MTEHVRYQHRANCKLITQFGVAVLDDRGFVTNPHDFNTSDLLTIPGMISTETFGGTVEPVHVAAMPQQDKILPSFPKVDYKPGQGPNENEYWQLIRDLTAGGKNLNSAGYIDMPILTNALREKGWPIISGTRRINITTAGRERDKASVDAPTNT
jgi:hypothetical protein